MKPDDRDLKPLPKKEDEALWQRVQGAAFQRELAGLEDVLKRAGFQFVTSHVVFGTRDNVIVAEIVISGVR